MWHISLACHCLADICGGWNVLVGLGVCLAPVLTPCGALPVTSSDKRTSCIVLGAAGKG